MPNLNCRGQIFALSAATLKCVSLADHLREAGPECCRGRQGGTNRRQPSLVLAE
jgi:hypothetical protein